jgi:uncharacterized protein (TIGR03382 family)
MKKALQKHSFRTAGLALAIGLGLAASMHSAQAAIVQITLNRIFTAPSTTSDGSGYVNDVTGQSTASTLYLTSSNLNNDEIRVSLGNQQMFTETAGAYFYIDPFGNPASGSTSGSFQITFKDTRINNNQTTTGYAQGVGAINGSTYSATLTRVVFDNEDSSFPGSFSATTNYPDAFPSSTAVPEPGAFIPAAVLVAGALLRRRRSRSHRSGRAMA